MTSGSAGTPGYQAPEVISKKSYSYSADVFSFGVHLYECCSPKRPFSKNGPVTDKLEFGGSCSHFTQPFKDLLSKLLKKDPAERISCNDKGWTVVKEDPWFATLDWDKLSKKDLPTPFKPEADRANCSAEHELEAQFFDEDDKIPTPSQEQQKAFEGYEYNCEVKKHVTPS